MRSPASGRVLCSKPGVFCCRFGTLVPCLRATIRGDVPANAQPTLHAPVALPWRIPREASTLLRGLNHGHLSTFYSPKKFRGMREGGGGWPPHVQEKNTIKGCKSNIFASTAHIYLGDVRSSQQYSVKVFYKRSQQLRRSICPILRTRIWPW